MLISSASRAQDTLAYYGNLSLNSQLAIDTFAYTHVYGSIFVSYSSSATDPILEVGPLNSLRYLSGSVIMEYNDQLRHVNGFDSLYYMGGSLEVLRNDSLRTFSGFHNITDNIPFRIDFDDNPELTDVHIYERIDTVNNLRFFKNHRLTTLRGFDSLSYADDLIISAASLDSVFFPTLRTAHGIRLTSAPTSGYYGFPVLDTVNTLRINSPADHIRGFDSLKYINGFFIIAGGTVSQITAFPELRHIGTQFSIENTNNLTDLQGFASLRRMGRSDYSNFQPPGADTSNAHFATLRIVENARLHSLSGLDSVEVVDWFNLQVWENDSLKNMAALSGVERFLRASIIRNGNLYSLEGIHNARDTMFSLEVRDNHHKPNSFPNDQMELSGLTEVVGFDSLLHIVEDCNVRGDDRLIYVDAFHNLESVGGNFDLWAGSHYFNMQGVYRTATKLRRAKSVGLINFYGYEPIPLDSLQETESMGIHGFSGVEIIEGIPNLRRLGGGNYHGGFGFHHMKSALQFGDLFHPDLVRIESATATQPGVVRIRNSPKINSLAGLAEFQKINGEFYIANTPALTDISNFYQLDSLIGNVVLIDLPLLQDCTPLCDLRENGYWPGEIETFGVVNPTCRSVEELLTLTCSPVDTEDLDEAAAELLAYPNPFGTALSVRLSAPGTGRLLLYDALGRMHLEQVVFPQQTEWTLSSETLPPGMYYLIFRDAGGEVTARRAVWRY